MDGGRYAINYVEGDDEFFQQPTDFKPHMSFHTMYARHARVVKVQGHFYFSHEPLPIFFLQDR